MSRMMGFMRGLPGASAYEIAVANGFVGTEAQWLASIGGGGGSGGPVGWDSVTDKPATFPPAAHGHAVADVAGLRAELDGKAATAHVHSIAGVTGLQAALDALAARQNNWIGTQVEYDALPQAQRDDPAITHLVVD